MKKLFSIFSTSFIGYLLIFFQTYIIHFDKKNNLSSTSIDVSYHKQIGLTSLIAFIFLFIIGCILMFNKRKLAKNKLVIICFVYITSSFIVSKEIFISRVSSWSTFTTTEENCAVFLNSFVGIFIGSIMYFLIVKSLLKSEVIEL